MENNGKKSVYFLQDWKRTEVLIPDEKKKKKVRGKWTEKTELKENLQNQMNLT